MEVMKFTVRRITFSKEEMDTLLRAKQILDNFVETVENGTFADDALDNLSYFLSEDIPDGSFLQEMEN